MNPNVPIGWLVGQIVSLYTFPKKTEVTIPCSLFKSVTKSGVVFWANVSIYLVFSLSLHLSIYLKVYLSISVSLYLSIYLLFIFPSIYLCIFLSLSLHLSFCFSTTLYISISLSLCLSLSIYLSTYLSLYLSFSLQINFSNLGPEEGRERDQIRGGGRSRLHHHRHLHTTLWKICMSSLLLLSQFCDSH